MKRDLDEVERTYRVDKLPVLRKCGIREPYGSNGGRRLLGELRSYLRVL
jgi:hypothetical protein